MRTGKYAAIDRDLLVSKSNALLTAPVVSAYTFSVGRGAWREPRQTSACHLPGRGLDARGADKINNIRQRTNIATSGTILVTYTYGAQSRRVRRNTSLAVTVYLDDGWNVAAEFKVSEGVPPVLSKTYLWGTDPSSSLQGAEKPVSM